MFAEAEREIEQILALVAKCPQSLQDKCFEMLLAAYLESVRAPAPLPIASPTPTPPAPGSNAAVVAQTGVVPDLLRTRFVAVAGRLKIPMERLAGLFDFQLDPYNFHALSVPGANKADRARALGLLLCAKSYLTMSDWTADWKEFRAGCIDHGCWDSTNMTTHLKKLGYFRSASAADGIALSPGGVSAAEALLARLAAPDTASAT